MIATRYLYARGYRVIFILEEINMSKRKFINKLGHAMGIKICDPGICDCCQYIGEGDFLCDKYTELVIADWVPTESFLICEEKS